MNTHTATTTPDATAHMQYGKTGRLEIIGMKHGKDDRLFVNDDYAVIILTTPYHEMVSSGALAAEVASSFKTTVELCTDIEDESMSKLIFSVQTYGTIRDRGKFLRTIRRKISKIEWQIFEEAEEDIHRWDHC